MVLTMKRLWAGVYLHSYLSPRFSDCITNSHDFIANSNRDGGFVVTLDYAKITFLAKSCKYNDSKVTRRN